MQVTNKYPQQCIHHHYHDDKDDDVVVATNSCRKNAQDQVGKKQTHPYGLLFDVKLSLRNFMELVN